MKTKTHGGKRPGSGRPPTDNPKKLLSVRINPELREWLRGQKNQAKTVEDALKEYRALNACPPSL